MEGRQQWPGRNRTNYPQLATPIGGVASANDKVIAIRIVPTPKPKGVVGSTALGSSTVHTATWFLSQVTKRKDAISLSRHLLHEWMHSAGFFHTSDGPNQKDVAYRMGDLIRQLATTPGTATDNRAGLRDELAQDALIDGVQIDLAPYLTEDDLAVYWLDEARDDVDGFDEDQSD